MANLILVLYLVVNCDTVVFSSYLCNTTITTTTTTNNNNNNNNNYDYYY